MNQNLKVYKSGRNDDTELYCLSDITSTFPFPAPAILSTVGAEKWPLIRQQYPQGFVGESGLVVQVTCYLMRRGGRTILVDTGLGHSFTAPTGQIGHGQLLDKLGAIGVAPTAIDTVFHTHLHQDHVGWNLHDAGNGMQPTFPNARYLAPQRDWAMYQQLLAAQAEGIEHVQQQLLPLEESGQFTLVEGEIELGEGICAFPTPGHSPGHMSIQVNTKEGLNYLIAGDAFFHPLQLAMPTAHTAIDARNDAEAANNTRLDLVERIQRENLLVSACHFYAAAFGRVVWEEVNGVQELVWREVVA